MAASPEPVTPIPVPGRSLGSVVVSWLTTTDHKKIGHLYLIASFGFFIVGGVLALLLRAELARPGMQIASNEQYNRIFTLHGTVMLPFFATPTFAGFANAIMPLQIGAPDVAFPRLNILSFWLFLFGGLIVVGSVLTPNGTADFGWTARTPLSGSTRTPSIWRRHVDHGPCPVRVRHDRLPRARRGPAGAGGGPEVRGPGPRPAERRCASVAAPVLVPRAS